MSIYMTHYYIKNKHKDTKYEDVDLIDLTD